MPNLIDDIEARTEHRKKKKKEYDALINLAVASREDKTLKFAVSQGTQTARLLDEGMVVDAYGYPLFFIKKGTLQAFYNNLSNDYVGSINIGHMDFASFPYLVGEWTKKDLTLVDIGDGRQGLDVKLNLDYESVFVKELQRKDYTVGISAEFYYDIDEETSDTLGLEVINAVNIKDFAIVGEAGNVSSSEIKLKGINNMSALDKLFAELSAKFEKKNNSVVEPVAEPQETTTEPVTEPGTGDDISETAEKMLKVMEGLSEENEQKTAEVEQLKAENERLQAELASKEGVIGGVMERFETICNKMLASEQEKKAAVEIQNNKKTSGPIQSEDGIGGLK